MHQGAQAIQFVPEDIHCWPVELRACKRQSGERLGRRPVEAQRKYYVLYVQYGQAWMHIVPVHTV